MIIIMIWCIHIDIQPYVNFSKNYDIAEYIFTIAIIWEIWTARLIKLVLHLKRRYSSHIRGDYTRGISQERVQVESFLKRHDAVASRGRCLPRCRAIGNIGVHLEVSSDPTRIGLKKLFASADAASEFIIYSESRADARPHAVGIHRSEFMTGSREGANIILFMNFWSFSGRAPTQK